MMAHFLSERTTDRTKKNDLESRGSEGANWSGLGAAGIEMFSRAVFICTGELAGAGPDKQGASF